MEPGVVAQLARHENERRLPTGDGSSVPVNSGLGAYVPLGGLPAGATLPRPGIRYVDSTAVGSVLVVRFRWPADEQDRDLMLPIDFGGFPGDVIGGATWLLEYVRQGLEHDRSWFPRDVVPISPRVAVVTPSRLPA